jgi:hypothetical protein
VGVSVCVPLQMMTDGIAGAHCGAAAVDYLTRWLLEQCRAGSHSWEGQLQFTQNQLMAGGGVLVVSIGSGGACREYGIIQG